MLGHEGLGLSLSYPRLRQGLYVGVEQTLERTLCRVGRREMCAHLKYTWVTLTSLSFFPFRIFYHLLVRTVVLRVWFAGIFG